MYETLSGLRCTVNMKNTSDSRCTEMQVWFSDHNITLFFFPFSTRNQECFKRAYQPSRTANFSLYSNETHSAKTNPLLRYQYLQTSKVIELKAQSMLLMTNSAGSLQLLPLARKSSSKRGTPINSEYTWCSLNGQPGKKTWMKAGIWAHKESQPWQGYHTEKDQLKKRLASK